LLACFVGLALTPSGCGSSATTASAPTSSPSGGYQSPYTLKYTLPTADLLAGFGQSPWNNPQLQSSVAYADWNSDPSSWGPSPTQYPAPTDLAGQSEAWKQQRLVATAALFLGTDYQHHHIPAWNPPAGWEWEQVSIGHNGPGIDCSDFSSFEYNYGLGIHLETDVVTQSTSLTNSGPGGVGTITATQINDPGSFAGLVASLHTGDLLYIKSDKGQVSHVIMWLGSVGVSPDGTLLVIDSHDNSPPITDANGKVVPAGVEIRPFEASGWYYRNFSHALRWV
jgi:hypothetical protein